MLKKIAIGALLTGLVAVLILGAVHRTIAVRGEGTGEAGRRGRVTASVTVDAGTLNYGGRGGVANEADRLGGRWGQGGAAEQAQAGQENALGGSPQADVLPADWRRVEGTVVSVADDLVEIRTAAGEVIPFEGQPLSYALAQGLSLQVGHAATLDGFDEHGEFKIGGVTSDGVSIALRDADGRPGWAGRGRQGK